MSAPALARRHLVREAAGLLTRLRRVGRHALLMPMVPGAQVSPSALVAIETHMRIQRGRLTAGLERYVAWMRSPAGMAAAPDEGQRRFSILKLQFNGLLDDFDIFADVLGQRSEHETGVWIAGLDRVAEDSLAEPGIPPPPPIICYLDRGHGAAIRRARTRLPGGDENPVAVIRVPRERMVGSGVGSSLIHEVGHQWAAMFDLVPSLTIALRAREEKAGDLAFAWKLWGRWISEIVADLWSVSRVGIGGPAGLIGLVSLPRFFVFRGGADDPHPIPFARVLISCAMGNALYPDPQWASTAETWRRLYPLRALPPERRRWFVGLLSTVGEFVSVLLAHRSVPLAGRTLGQLCHDPSRTPARLRAEYRSRGADPARLLDVRPCRALAVLAQARADGLIDPAAESNLLSTLLIEWGVRPVLRRSGRMPALRLPVAPASLGALSPARIA